MNVLHSSKSCIWYTPESIISRVTTVLGSIDLDPASDNEANKTVKAKRIITAEEDALAINNWTTEPVTLFLNPPNGMLRGNSIPVLFWDSLMYHRDRGYLKHAIYLGFSLSQLATTQSCFTPVLNFTSCIPRKRIAFVKPGEAKESPSQANFITYVPGLIDETTRFKEVFKPLGGFITAA